MSLQDILKRILDEAATEVKNIEVDTAKEKDILAEESAKIQKAEQDKLDAKTEAVLQSVEKKMSSMARRENSQSLLRAKRNTITSALDLFLKKLENADDKTYGQILEKLFAKTTLPSGKVFAPAKRLEITSRFAPPGFDVVTHKDIVGGFILQSGGTEVDNSFQSLVFSEFRDALTSYFADQLKFI
jgi:vacuolar-type H+-ATPase subunit E/Vma4